MEICDSLTILRDGFHIATENIKDLSIPAIEKLMVGKSLDYIKNVDNQLPEGLPFILEVRKLCKKK